MHIFQVAATNNTGSVVKRTIKFNVKPCKMLAYFILGI